jgi:glycerophosphoryl diester phosphodiesterase
MALISAHRCGSEDDLASENTREALVRAITLDCEYVEFDVRRLGDGTFVLFHDAEVEVGGKFARLDTLTYEQFAAEARKFLRFEEALEILRGYKRAHIDLKFVSPEAVYADPANTYEVQACEVALAVLGGAGEFIVTSLEDETIGAVRAWARTRHPELLVGLSLGRDLKGASRLTKARARRRELLPSRRLAETGANMLVAHRQLARLNLARVATYSGVPLLVWTVDDPRELERWLTDPRVWMLTSNYPRRAIEIRDRLDASTPD